MIETLVEIYESISNFDLIYLIITILSLIKCSRKGFVLSILAASKWLLAYVITLILFPKAKPYVKNIIDNEFVLDVSLGIGIFVVVIFIILMINKSIGKAVSYSGLGKLDASFGFFFGFIRGYIIAVCIFSTVSIIYNHSKWPMKLDESLFFPYVEKGSNYLIKEFPNEKNYEDTKEKIQEL
jgi:membrane protein required for colicin V production